MLTTIIKLFHQLLCKGNWWTGVQSIFIQFVAANWKAILCSTTVTTPRPKHYGASVSELQVIVTGVSTAVLFRY